jgi:hypothetical protein
MIGQQFVAYPIALQINSRTFPGRGAPFGASRMAIDLVVWESGFTSPILAAMAPSPTDKVSIPGRRINERKKFL